MFIYIYIYNSENYIPDNVGRNADMQYCYEWHIN